MSDTAKPTVFVTRRLPPRVEARLTRDYDARLNADETMYDTEALIAGAEGAQALLVCPTDRVSAEVIARLPESITAIATFSVGYDHVDIAAAAKRGITVTHTPDVLTNATADMSMLLLLGAARQARAGEAMVREATWTAWAPTGILGVEVSGKPLGILGMGRIGRAVAKRARGFDMEIHYQDVVRSPDDEKAGAQYHETAESLMGVSAFLTIHCPATPETYHLLNAERIALLPDGAVVVNAARGDIVDDEALIAAVRSGKVAAIGLDVYEGEPNLNPAYRTLDNSFLMPHLGSATVETRDAMGFTALDNLDAIFAGRTPPNSVT
jgi:lactate dehydrogenase-like 2-hydroxyacid dehydrogenase